MQNCFMELCKLIGSHLRKQIDSTYWTNADVPLLTHLCNAIYSTHFYFRKFATVSEESNN